MAALARPAPLLHVLALSLALAVLTPVPRRASRRTRAARRVLAGGGGLAIGVAITFSLMGRWVASGLAGCAAILVVAGCLWIGLSARLRRDRDDEDDEHGGGGPPTRPEPPAPPQPVGDVDESSWAEFDRARAGWEPSG